MQSNGNKAILWSRIQLIMLYVIVAYAYRMVLEWTMKHFGGVKSRERKF